MQNESIAPGDIVQIAENVFGRVLDVYSNGYETTAGFAEGSPEKSECVSVTYITEHADSLPFDAMQMLWLDDRSVRQRLKEILWERDYRIFKMEDGYESDSITS